MGADLDWAVVSPMAKCIVQDICEDALQQTAVR